MDFVTRRGAIAKRNKLNLYNLEFSALINHTISTSGYVDDAKKHMPATKGLPTSGHPFQ
jgi:hypothetical protein